MAAHSVASLVSNLRRSGILEEKQLGELPQLQANFADVQAFAKELMRRGWVTAFQINKVAKGLGKELVLGPYLILQPVGQGGMGTVYKAKHIKMRRIVALKVIRKERLASADAVSRFYREVRAAAQLSHANIVHAFDADQFDNTHVLAMEYIDGPDLHKRVKERGPLPIEEACEYMRQAALGLQHAHEHGLVHRDIKPSNLLLQKPKTGISGSGVVVKVLDLGLARSADDASSVLTADGAVVGTIDYVAPEQAMDSHEVDIRADLYSLGCTFYFLLSGVAPFAGGTAMSKLSKHRFEEPKRVEELRTDVAPEVAALVRRLMAKKPEDRFQTPAEVARALEPFTLRGGAVASPVPEASAIAQPSGPPGVLLPEPAVRPSREAILLPDLGPGSGATAIDAFADTGSPLRQPFRRPRNLILVGAAAGAVLVVGASFFLFRSGASRPATTREPIQPVYVKRPTRQETILATMQACRVPTFEGKWYVIGPFDNTGNRGFTTIFPPELEIDLTRTYLGKAGTVIGWKEFTGFQVGKIVPLGVQGPPGINDFTCYYLFHEIEADEALALPVGFTSDDTLNVWLNREQVAKREQYRGTVPDQDQATLLLKPGKNQLLAKVCNGGGPFAFYAMPRWPVQTAFEANLRRDFP